MLTKIGHADGGRGSRALRGLALVTMDKRLSGGIFTASACLYVLAIAWIGRVPFIDDIVFKSPGRELATTGNFTAPELRYFVIPVSPSPASIYGLQPPLYPLCFAAWSWLVGFGWRQAFLFDAAIHVGLCVLAGAIARAMLPAKTRGANWWVATALLATGTSGRPDELAASLCILALLILSKHPGSSGTIAAGCFGAAAAFTSPIGLVFCGIASLGFVVDRSACGAATLWRLMLAAVTCGLLVLIVIGFVRLRWPGALRQFLEHARAVRGHSSVAANWEAARTYWKWVILGTLGLLLGSLCAAGFRQLTARSALALVRCVWVWVGVLLALTCFHNPYYLWFFAPYLAFLIAMDGCALWQSGSRAAFISAVAIALCGLTAGSIHDLFRTVSLMRAPPNQGWSYNTRLVQAIIPAGATVLTDEHWFSLADRRHVLDAYFSRADTLKVVDYIVLTGNGSGYVGRRKALTGPKERIIEEDFELLHDNINRTPLSVFGRKIGRSAYGMGFVVFKRRAH